MGAADMANPSEQTRGERSLEESHPSGEGREGRQQKSVVAFFASHPLLGLAASLASIISIPLGIYLYFAGSRSRNLDFYVSPTTTTIVKSGETSNLRVLYGDKPVTTDVTGLQVVVWNDGQEAIHSQDVLDPIVIKTSAPILEARIRQVSRETTRFAVDPSRATEGRLGVSWKILEHNDGAVIQLIVAGNSPSIRYEGTVEGQRELSVVRASRSRWYFDIMLVVAGALIFTLLQEAFYDVVRKRSFNARTAAYLAVAGLAVVAVYLAVREPGPPSILFPVH
jgi:hypothetical protein